MNIMKYILIIIATLFFQISCEKRNKSNGEKKYKWLSDEYHRRVDEVRGEMLKKERAKRDREVVKGCSVIAWVNGYEASLNITFTPEVEVFEDIRYNETIPDPLVRSVAFNDIEAVRCLLEASHDPDTRSSPIPFQEEGEGEAYGMGYAIDYNFLEIVKLLIKHGANVNATHSDGKPFLLNFAQREGHKEIIKILEANGATE